DDARIECSAPAADLDCEGECHDCNRGVSHKDGDGKALADGRLPRHAAGDDHDQDGTLGENLQRHDDLDEIAQYQEAVNPDCHQAQNRGNGDGPHAAGHWAPPARRAGVSARAGSLRSARRPMDPSTALKMSATWRMVSRLRSSHTA